MKITETHRISLARAEDYQYTEVETIKFMMSRYNLCEDDSRDLIANIKEQRQQVRNMIAQFFNPN